jgi:hypothetical protein
MTSASVLSTGEGLFIGFAGSIAAIATAVWLWGGDLSIEEWPGWKDSFVALMAVLLLNVSGWIVAVCLV